MPKFKYKTIDHSTLAGFERLERLVLRLGWKIVHYGPFTADIKKEIKPRKKGKGKK